MMFTQDQLVRDIAVQLPGATAVFRRHKIDFCCKGGVPLAEAAQGRGVDLAALLDALNGLQPAAREAPDTTTELIPYILARYHEVHRQEFPEARDGTREVVDHGFVAPFQHLRPEYLEVFAALFESLRVSARQALQGRAQDHERR